MTKTNSFAKADHPVSGKRASGGDKAKEPAKGGAQARIAQEWGGGSKASKSKIPRADRENSNSSQRS
ncbi:MAG: hypothetical protein EOQ42_02645 [Mesorhizobium sp.]|uniref:hypothetical protein n=1 Tax=unclassified Mesorhizobium TaxID=325217 RepID=UPI000FE564B0|nr:MULTISPECIES: hypothetical protein [unclassified Mesorhizobium]RWB34182.1 MAG: hypothetical protein EOQ43_00490 [Mesorhizobium sp.]RWB81439.1 MAG: hypothetical protein EOQ42_02645 [Mesorhizobium sp.]RWC20177.1 MAG: hypothetical protein EOS51_13990 [Mesorhizobium sp.]RWD20909.1 MAG: hypothetical protein EOS57_07700 [Mesorhizobium sp.]TGT95284.1 hypothetical protein EN807_18125 [Mesorhizobium sp. M5C.F.Ca.ET.164.01.1.1]